MNAAILFHLGMGAGKFYPALDYFCDIPGLQGNRRLTKLRRCVTATVSGQGKKEF